MKNKASIFYPGLDNSQAYRIPALLNSSNNVLLATNDARIVSQRDNPNKINNVVRRSLDQGKTWEDIQTTVSFLGEGLQGPAAIDSCLLEDSETGTLFILYSHSPGGVGAFISQQGSGFNSRGEKFLLSGTHQLFYLTKAGEVYTHANDQKTSYRVNEVGEVFFADEKLGTIYETFNEEKPRNLFEIPTCFLQVIKSEDHGVTWSKPIDLNIQVKEEWMRFIGSGPGVGIQLKNGIHKGRLLYPIYYTNGASLFSCALIYSDDHGKTWQRGKSPNDHRKMISEDTNSENLGQDVHRYELTENQVVELHDGTLVLFMRNHFGNGRVAKAESHDGGETWGEISFVEELINPVCQFSVIRYNDLKQPEKDMLIFVGPDSETKRAKGTVKVSLDGGQTWPYAKVVEEGPFMYSSVTQLENGNLGILYESEEKKTGLVESIYVEVLLEEVMQ